MSLRNGTPYWQAIGTAPIEASALAGDMRCEVAVLGGGITGALVAHCLSEAGVDVVILDKREFGTGSTAACTGLLQYEIDTPLVDLVGLIGETASVHAYARGVKAIDEIDALTQSLDDSCGFRRRQCYYFASRRWHFWRLKREFEYRREHGFDVEFVDRQKSAREWSVPHAAILSHGGQIDPYRFTQALLRRARSQGARLFAGTVTDIEEGSAVVVLRSSSGSVIADRVIFATGYDSYRYLPRGRGRLHSTYAVASEPLSNFSGWPDGALLWETARPYFYARQTDDGRALIGGGDTSFASDHRRDDLLERKTAQLEKRFRRLFPATEFEPAFAWSGVFGESKDGLPYIGQVAEHPRAYFAVGYGGNGITFSVIAARLLTDLYLGRPNADARVFGFDR